MRKKSYRRYAFWTTIAIVSIYALFHVFYKNYLDYQAKKIELYYPEFSYQEPNYPMEELAKEENDLLEQKVRSDEALLGERTIPIDERDYSESDDIILPQGKIPHSLEGTRSKKGMYDEHSTEGLRGLSQNGSAFYRVLINSFDTDTVKEKIDSALATFQAIKADRVIPGTFVPGGFYYHMFVPNKQLKGFLAAVTSGSSAKVYLSQDKRGGRAGMTRVFLWLKKQ